MSDIEEIRHERTEHFEFTLYVTKRFSRDIHISTSFLVGSKETPCLSIVFYTKEASQILPESMVQVPTLSNIESLYSCIDKEIEEESYQKYSFGVEIFQWIYTYLRDTQPHIKTMMLNDNSYIPCNREKNDTVDLCTYSIAHYGNTWYERQFHAYMKPDYEYEKYRSAVKKYCSKEYKESVTWDMFYYGIFTTKTEEATKIMNENIEKYKALFESSETFPDFFKGLTRTLEKSQKCAFYRSWLETFIYSVIPVSRRWYLDIHRTKQGGKKRHSKTMKNRSHRQSHPKN